MTLTDNRALPGQASDHVQAVEDAAEKAMEANEIGVGRLAMAEAAHHVAQLENLVEKAHKDALAMIKEGARGGTLCSSMEQWTTYVYVAGRAADARLYMAVAGEAVQALTEGESYFKP